MPRDPVRRLAGKQVVNCWKPWYNDQTISSEADMTHYVYKITNLANGKAYIGITSRTPSIRWGEHIQRARQDVRNSRLAMAMRKYGETQFELETIDQANSEDVVRQLEQDYIAHYDTYENGYNANLGGYGHFRFPAETKRKISEAQKGKVISLESRQKMSEAKKGDPKCAENFGEHTNKGKDNPRSKWFVVEDPEGHIIVGKGIRAFCRDYNLLHCKLSSTGKTKGYKLVGTFNDYPEREYTQASGSATEVNDLKI